MFSICGLLARFVALVAVTTWGSDTVISMVTVASPSGAGIGTLSEQEERPRRREAKIKIYFFIIILYILLILFVSPHKGMLCSRNTVMSPIPVVIDATDITISSKCVNVRGYVVSIN